MRERFKSESEVAIHILRELNEKGEGSAYFKIFPLYHIGSKSRELQKDRMFWIMLSTLTVQNKIINNSSKLKQLSIIAYCVSRLPRIDWVSQDLVEELCEKISSDSLNGKTSNERLNIIDINQILSFFQFVEAQKGIKYDKIWSNYETLILTMLETLDGKNLAIITHRFSHQKKGSIEFWASINQQFSMIFNDNLSMQDCTVIIHSFSLMNMLSKEKFIALCFSLFDRSDAKSAFSPLDLSQLLSTAKNQDLVSA